MEQARKNLLVKILEKQTDLQQKQQQKLLAANDQAKFMSKPVKVPRKTTQSFMN